MKCVGLVTSKGRDAIRANLVMLEPIKRDQLTIYLSAIIPESVKKIWREIDLLKRPTGRYFYDEEVTNAPDESAARGRPANTQTKEEEVGTPLRELQKGERDDQDTTRPLPPPLPHGDSRQGVRPCGEEDQTGVDGVSSGILLMKPLTQQQMARQAKKRPDNFWHLTPTEQWAIDKELGILDWNGTPGDLSHSMKKVLRNLHEGLPYDTGFHGRSQMGGLHGTILALTRRGLLKDYQLTPAGQKIAKTL